MTELTRSSLRLLKIYFQTSSMNHPNFTSVITQNSRLDLQVRQAQCQWTCRLHVEDDEGMRKSLFSNCWTLYLRFRYRAIQPY